MGTVKLTRPEQLAEWRLIRETRLAILGIYGEPTEEQAAADEIATREADEWLRRYAEESKRDQ